MTAGKEASSSTEPHGCDTYWHTRGIKNYSRELESRTIDLPAMGFEDNYQLAQPLSYEGYCALAVLLLYEFLITFARELHLIWRGKITGANVLFALNRYLVLIYAFLYLLPEYWDCAGTKTYQLQVSIFALQIALYTIWAAFSALRVYAISGHHLLLAGLTLLLGLAPVVTNMCFDIYHTWFNGPRGCTLIPHFSVPDMFKFVAYERSSMIASDLVVLSVTWYKAYESRANIDWSSARLSVLLLRDGTVYFMILLILNILQIIAWATKSFSTVAYPAQIATSMLISRFLLNLRQGNDASADLPTNQTSIGDMAFASRIVGNIGAELDYGSPWTSRSPAIELADWETVRSLSEDNSQSDGTLTIAERHPSGQQA